MRKFLRFCCKWRLFCWTSNWIKTLRLITFSKISKAESLSSNWWETPHSRRQLSRKCGETFRFHVMEVFSSKYLVRLGTTVNMTISLSFIIHFSTLNWQTLHNYTATKTYHGLELQSVCEDPKTQIQHLCKYKCFWKILFFNRTKPIIKPTSKWNTWKKFCFFKSLFPRGSLMTQFTNLGLEKKSAIHIHVKKMLVIHERSRKCTNKHRITKHVLKVNNDVIFMFRFICWKLLWL